jgi:hypothetical protein
MWKQRAKEEMLELGQLYSAGLSLERDRALNVIIDFNVIINTTLEV